MYKQTLSQISVMQYISAILGYFPDHETRQRTDIYNSHNEIGKYASYCFSDC